VSKIKIRRFHISRGTSDRSELTVYFHGFRELTDLLAFGIEKIARQNGRGKAKVRVLIGYWISNFY